MGLLTRFRVGTRLAFVTGGILLLFAVAVGLAVVEARNADRKVAEARELRAWSAKASAYVDSIAAVTVWPPRASQNIPSGDCTPK